MLRCIITFVLCFSALTWAQDVPLVLSGKVSSAAKQIVNAPRSSSWQIQIQWMAEEGDIVQKGEPVVVFDGAATQAQLEQNKERLDTLNLEFKQLKMRLEQAVTEAQGRLAVAQMRVAKARIPVSIVSDTLNAYQRGQNELALERALMEQGKAREAVIEAEQQLKAGLEKKRIDILQIEDEITYLAGLMEKLNVTAQHTGSVSYALHPWYGRKLRSGMNVQQSWKVLDVQASTDLQIESYVHEIDALILKEGDPVTLTFDAFPGSYYSGTIASISRQVEKNPQLSNASYFPVIIEFNEVPERDLMIGMSVRIDIRKEFVSTLIRDYVGPSSLTVAAELKSLQDLSFGPPSISRMWNYKVQKLVADNQSIQQGDLLIQFDGQDLRNRLVGQQADLDAATKELENIQLQDNAREKDLELALAEARMNEEKAQRKAKITDASRSEIERRQQQADWDITRVLSEQAQQRLDEHRLRKVLNKQVQQARIANHASRVKEIRQNMAKLQVKSPVDGIAIINKNNDGDRYAVGDNVHMGNTLVNVPSLDKLAVKMEIDESDTQKVAIGQRVDIVLTAYPEQTFKGTITSKGKSYRAKSQRNQRIIFDAWVTFDEIENAIMRPGMQANVTLPLNEEGLALVPDANEELVFTETLTAETQP
ncbi:MAG: HlyD family efflux transporter periplasmic adaptor subunit [Alteromonadaceae bacterium]|nr:HlyD family efflux transporter periplasmic adaptor subunit [Alteromonadaceae bacterium]